MIAYAITDPSTLNFQTLESDLKRFASKADMIAYRDKSTDNYTLNAKQFIQEAKKLNFQKILLHTDYYLAYQLKADGVHLKSTQFEDIQKAKALGLWVIISTHSLEEALDAELLGADMISYSPIFATPNKGKPKGLEALNEVTSILSIPVIALGGILTQEQLILCEENGAEGFASIRYFT
jgi:thiamine-phosphate pyrophosphorylase